MRITTPVIPRHRISAKANLAGLGAAALVGLVAWSAGWVTAAILAILTAGCVWSYHVWLILQLRDEAFAYIAKRAQVLDAERDKTLRLHRRVRARVFDEPNVPHRPNPLWYICQVEPSAWKYRLEPWDLRSITVRYNHRLDLDSEETANGFRRDLANFWGVEADTVTADPPNRRTRTRTFRRDGTPGMLHAPAGTYKAPNWDGDK